MSVQFGRWNLAGEPLTADYTSKLDAILAPFGPDGAGSFSQDGVDILFRGFHTTKESRSETQPHIFRSGLVLTWDGRLDNRDDLLREPGIEATIASTDLAIVAAAFDRWGTRCLARLLGDWALSVWNPHDRSLVLAKDFVGTRPLFYSFDKNQITWSTILDALLLSAGKEFVLDEEYIAGWLSFFPAAHLTPYRDVHAVPPSSFVLLRPGQQTIEQYWDFDSGKTIHYRADTEYEEHFRTALAQSVQRRLRSDQPVLAELSGGLDSSSIVCIADLVMARGADGASRLNTVSYYSDCEPDWNERPYFVKVEEKRGRVGCHIEVGDRELDAPEFEEDVFAATPACEGRGGAAKQRFAKCLASQDSRVVLSGIGGDEVTGGVPTPIPELMDLLARVRLRLLARQLKIWALSKRKPWIYLFFETVRGFLPSWATIVPKYMRAPGWLDQDFVKRNRVAITGYRSRVKLFGPRPTFQQNMSTLNALRRQLGCSTLPINPLYEIRYPYLDRTLLEFLYAVPRDQLLRPGERRSLMRRALVGIVPEELLNRKRKAFARRLPTAAISIGWDRLIGANNQILTRALGIVDSRAFAEEVNRARSGKEVNLVAMMRMLTIESWLRALERAGKLKASPASDARRFQVLGDKSFPDASVAHNSSAS